MIASEYSGLTAAEHTDIYYRADGQPLDRQRQKKDQAREQRGPIVGVGVGVERQTRVR